MNNRHKLIFEYDGTNFNGWQNQPEGRTVQGVVQKAFSTFYQQKVNIVGQGRTDAGVHAKAQVAHVDLPPVYKLDRLYRAMNGLLPEDVALIRAEKVEEDFHARFHAKSRSYEYRILERFSPLRRNFAWTYVKPISFNILQECAQMITGEHDFINFCIPAGKSGTTTTCLICRSEWKREDNALIFNITGNRFLHHLVRRLVGTMVKVADGTLEPSEFRILLKGKETDRKGHSAPARGLVLTDVTY